VDDVSVAAFPTSSGSRTKKSSVLAGPVPNPQERAHTLGGFLRPGRIGHAQDDLFQGWLIEESPRGRGVRHDDGYSRRRRRPYPFHQSLHRTDRC
jgi:hypothetical protein